MKGTSSAWGLSRASTTVALAIAAAFLGWLPAAAAPQLQMCGNRPNTPTKTCLVDGDTLWLDGENIRLKDFDTPEPQSAICGGEAERALAHQASARLLELLNTSDWTIERFGYDSTSSRRRLATIRIAGRDVGDILIDERLARRWPDGREWWC
ncbi:MAG: thermonuclease family protein [Devosia sp.]